MRRVARAMPVDCSTDAMGTPSRESVVPDMRTILDHATGLGGWGPPGYPIVLLHRRGPRRLVPRGHEDLCGIHRVEAVVLAAEVAGDVDLAALGQDAVGLLAAEAADHAGHALAAAGAREAGRLR